VKPKSVDEPENHWWRQYHQGNLITWTGIK
jgi:hypothetical protein